MRRVVVTGLGLVTPLACGVEESWAALAGRQVRRQRRSPNSRPTIWPTKIACQVPRGDGADGTLQSRPMG